MTKNEATQLLKEIGHVESELPTNDCMVKYVNRGNWAFRDVICLKLENGCYYEIKV